MIKKKSVVTGAAGFIGRTVAERYIQEGRLVLLVDQLKNFENILAFQGMEMMDPQDFLNQKASFYADFDTVIHMGAITDTMCQDEKALAFWNTGYSQLLWKLCAQHQLGFVYASSAATYGDGAYGYRDDISLIPVLKPLNLYAWSKQHFDQWVIQQTQMVPRFWSGWKFFNVYGVYEHHKRKMASMVHHAYHQIQKTKKVQLFKSDRKDIPDGHQKRDFVFVQDVVDVLQFAVCSEVNGIFNLGSGQARSFLDLVNAVFDVLGVSPHIEFIETPLSIKKGYQYLTEAKLEKLRQVGYFKPMCSLEQGVASVVSSFLKG